MARNVHITSFHNQRGDIQVDITRDANSYYVVTVTDVEAEETLPAARRFAQYGDARAYAISCVESGEDTELPF